MSRVLPRLAALVLVLASTLGLLAGPAAATSPARAPGLTPYQERVVLGLIDDICGDTWCEGDFAFDFRSFSCDADRRSCTLRLRIASWDREPLQWRWRSGDVRGFVRFRQMVHVSGSGHRSLTPGFYDAVNALISRIEASVPRRG